MKLNAIAVAVAAALLSFGAVAQEEAGVAGGTIFAVDEPVARLEQHTQSPSAAGRASSSSSSDKSASGSAGASSDKSSQGGSAAAGASSGGQAKSESKGGSAAAGSSGQRHDAETIKQVQQS